MAEFWISSFTKDEGKDKNKKIRAGTAIKRAKAKGKLDTSLHTTTRNKNQKYSSSWKVLLQTELQLCYSTIAHRRVEATETKL
jgi:hypothetical protein